MSMINEDGAVRATLVVQVIDWWTEEPLQGVPVRIAWSPERISKECPGCHLSTLTDHEGRATFPIDPGHVHILIRPDFRSDAYATPGDVTEVQMLCPDFVKAVRHGFNH